MCSVLLQFGAFGTLSTRPYDTTDIDSSPPDKDDSDGTSASSSPESSPNLSQISRKKSPSASMPAPSPAVVHSLNSFNEAASKKAAASSSLPKKRSKSQKKRDRKKRRKLEKRSASSAASSMPMPTDGEFMLDTTGASAPSAPSEKKADKKKKKAPNSDLLSRPKDPRVAYVCDVFVLFHSVASSYAVRGRGVEL